jgi:UDPglucose 6-dehydrogenase
MVIPKKIIRRFGKNLSGRTFAIWGLSFKPETDDMRDASSIVIINELTKRGAKIQAYDPKAVTEAKECYLKKNSKVAYCKNKQAALKGADALILVTEWKEFRSPDFEKIKKSMKQNIIFDGRNIYDRKKMEEDGFEYFGIGV